jgi:D-alanine-D-alanine ligase
MRVGVVHTVGSPCRCAEAVSVGLLALNHDPFLVDSADIEAKAPALAGECDLVIDHTDTYCGRGLYRPLVRLLLENWGARIVGSSAKACFIADNKDAAKKCLADAGIPVPPGIAVRSNAWTLPRWLNPPLILKPAFEHMSRGISIAHTEQEAYAAAARLLDSLRQPVLVESYIPGRELAVSLIAGPRGIEVLPILEWEIDSTAILTEDFKLMDPGEERHRTLRAELAGDLKTELEELARRAFRALELQDYARFDVRLSQNGSVFFLEANTTPSFEPLEALAVSAQWAGLDYPSLVERLLTTAGRRFECSDRKKNRILQVPLATGPLELEIPQGVHSPSPSTIELAGLLDIRESEEALELGCGSGVLSISMAKLGAKQVIATDIDPITLQAAMSNARRNRVEGRIEFRAGSWYEALDRNIWGPGRKLFDVIVATPPQTPGPYPFGSKYGGRDGTKHLFNVLRGAPDFLKPEGGRLWLLAISLANPGELWKELHALFSEVDLIHETERPFAAEEYEKLEAGLFEYLVSLRSSGNSEFKAAENGYGSFRNLFIRASRPRKI